MIIYAHTYDYFIPKENINISKINWCPVVYAWDRSHHHNTLYRYCLF